MQQERDCRTLLAILKECSEPPQTFGKDGGRSEQAHDKEGFGFEIEEVAGLDDNVLLPKQAQRPFFFA